MMSNCLACWFPTGVEGGVCSAGWLLLLMVELIWRLLHLAWYRTGFTASPRLISLIDCIEGCFSV